MLLSSTFINLVGNRAFTVISSYKTLTFIKRVKYRKSVAFPSFVKKNKKQRKGQRLLWRRPLTQYYTNQFFKKSKGLTLNKGAGYFFYFVCSKKKNSFFSLVFTNFIKYSRYRRYLGFQYNEKFGLFTKERTLKYRYYRKCYYRYALLDRFFHKKNKKAYKLAKKTSVNLVKNNYWLRNKKRALVLKLYWRKYRFMRSYRPYSYLDKKYKLFFNWADKAKFKRYPVLRRKYTISYLCPRYIDYRRLFKNQIREQHLFRWLFRLKYSQLVDKFKKSVSKTKRTFEYSFLNFFEMRMDTVVYRLNFAFTLKQAKQWVNRSFFMVNSKNIAWHSYHVQVGDIVMPILEMRLLALQGKRLDGKILARFGQAYMNLRLFYRQIQLDQYPSHFMLNERVPAGLAINLPNPFLVRYNKSFSAQFLTLSLNKYS